MSESTPKEAAERLRSAMRTASAGLVEREALVELIVLAAVAGEHLLVIGPPGTAKSEAARRIARAVGGGVEGAGGATYFEYLLGRFTEPSELFGPVDLRRLKEGLVVTDTAGMLPEAQIAFLDEVFLGSTAILNTLLGLLNDRRFRRGHTDLKCPLRVCVGASNGLPDDPALAAFADRFLLRVFVDVLPDPRLEELLEGGWALATTESVPTATVDDIDVLARHARAMDLGPVRGRLATAIRTLRRAGIDLSDRRAVKTQKLVAAAAALAGRDTPTEADLWPIVTAVPTAHAQGSARSALHDLLAASESASLPSAAVMVSQGPLARAQLLVEAGTALLDTPTPDEDWRLRAEGVLREVDAGFERASLPEALAAVRTRLADALGS
ncbi:MAG: AAA family ATPase [Alphaproteobacteria bacterium]|nr:AAA family ATPase [Alphaproteobacteria bacterium]